MGFDEKVVRVRAAGSGLGHSDLVASVKKVTHSNAECGLNQSC
jgi:hypothetical protein